MSTLTYSTTHLAPAEPAIEAPRRPFWRRVFDGIIDAQQRRAEREIARYLANHGGLLNDDMERQIMERLTGTTRRSL